MRATGARRNEFLLLRWIGTTGRQLRAILREETLPAVALGTGVVYATLSANATGMTFRPVRPAPYAPPLTYLTLLHRDHDFECIASVTGPCSGAAR
ncbi:hypothetical protein OG372_17410 [Streptomyces sp. NBC_01020]|uniref:hypothetical protein n=1 Tax=Streptomyces sp. NBC_01020 TaxID=2903722 RepID=UPI003865CE86|nr:hypothetical protein OG372_17410 [Streptomyces sp. NBC_01020]